MSNENDDIISANDSDSSNLEMHQRSTLTDTQHKELEAKKERKPLVDSEFDDDFGREEYDSDEEFMLEDVEIHKNVATFHESTTGTSGPLGVCTNIFISFVGAGMLGLPNAFRQSGWMLGSVVLSIVSVLNVYAMLLLVRCRKKLERDGHQHINGYGDLGRIVLGPRGESFVNFCIVVSQVGFGTAYLIFVAANVTNMYPSISRGFVCLACIPILTLLVQIKEMKKLSPFSLLADVCNLIGLSSVLLQDATTTYEIYHDPSHPNHEVDLAHFSSVLYVIGIAMYSLEGVGLILSLESSCKDREQFPFLLKMCLAFVTLLMVVFGTAGYFTFGSGTLAPITLNLEGYSSTFVIMALCLALYLTYPVMLFPVHDIVEESCRRCTKKRYVSDEMLANTSISDLPADDRSDSSQPLSTTRTRLLRASGVFISAFIAYAVPDFGKFLALVGSSLCVILGFILPTYFHLQVFDKSELKIWERFLDMFLLIFGVLFGIFGTYRSLLSLLRGGGDESE